MRLSLGERNQTVFSRTATDTAQASKHSSVVWINWLEVKVALHVYKAGKAVETQVFGFGLQGTKLVGPLSQVELQAADLRVSNK